VYAFLIDFGKTKQLAPSTPSTPSGLGAMDV
jgi:hypothetical protein